MIRNAIYIILFILLLSFPGLSYAQENKTEQIIVSKNEVIDNDYLKTSDSVRISGTINGDAYIAAGTIDVDGNINGDLLAAGGNILITGTVKNDIRIAGGNLTISGAKVGGNITVIGGQILIDKSTSIAGSIVGAGGNLSILGPVGRGVTIGGGQVTIGNNIGGDILAGVGTLSVLNDVNVKGNLTYYSEEKAIISDNASISGKIRHEIIPTPYPKSEVKSPSPIGIFGLLILFKVSDLIMLFILGLLTLIFLPKYSSTAKDYIKSNPIMSLVIGVLAMFLTPIILIALLMTGIGIPLSLFLLVVYLAALWYARIFGIMTIGEIISQKLDKKIGSKWSYVIGIIVYAVLGVIPVISFFSDLLILLLGFGSMMYTKKYYYSILRSKNII